MANEKIGNFSIAQGSARGGRDYQEDRYFVAPSHLQTAQEAQSFLIEHFAQLGSQTQSYKCGSTASVAVITPDNRLTVANIGDSPIMVFARDKRTGVVRGIDLAECHTVGKFPIFILRVQPLLPPSLYW
jgi:serine/threonine protein phosphatase PrpC